MDGNLAYCAGKTECYEEMLGGKVLLMSPRPSVNHNQISINIINIFSPYLKGKKCRVFGDGVDLYLDGQNRFVPDGMIVCHPEYVQRDGVHGAPDLVAEVLSPSTLHNDRGYKKEAYEAAGIQEYWIIEPETRSLEVYRLRNGRYVLESAYSIYPDYLLARMDAEERARIPMEFRCSLFEDLVIRLEDVFERVI